MRVIAGKYKRRQLVAPPGTDITRPTGDRVKESLFNIIASDLDDSIVLDLFAGSGALGIEALSRGAKRVYFVENNDEALNCLKRNLDSLAISSQQAVVVKSDVQKFLENPQALLPKTISKEEIAASITLIFSDPPYASSWYDEAIAQLHNSGLCSDDCKLLLEMDYTRSVGHALEDDNAPTNATHPGWRCLDERTYGKTRIEIWHYSQRS